MIYLSLVGTVTTSWFARPRNHGSVPAKSSRLCLLQNIETRAQSYVQFGMSRGCITGNASWSIGWQPSKPSREVRNTWSSTHTIRYVFMLWCLIKQRDKYTLQAETFTTSINLYFCGITDAMQESSLEVYSDSHGWQDFQLLWKPKCVCLFAGESHYRQLCPNS